MSNFPLSACNYISLAILVKTRVIIHSVGMYVF